MDLEQILNTIQPFLVMFVALTAAFLTAIWISAIIWTFRDIRARTRDVFAQVLATLMVLIFFPLFPLPGMILYFILRPRETLAEIYERTLEEEALLQGIEERLACPSCNRRIEEDYVVCPACHTRLKKGCTSCGRLLHLSWTVCAYCGAAQTMTQTVIPPRPVAMAIESPADAPALPEPEGGAQGEVETGDNSDLTAEAEAATPELEDEPGLEAEAGQSAGPDSELGSGAEADVEAGPEPVEEVESDLGAEPEPTLEADTASLEPEFELEIDAEPAADAEIVVPEEG